MKRFRLKILDKTSVDGNSLVDEPAILTNWVKFNKDHFYLDVFMKKDKNFSFSTEEEKKRITGPLMIPNIDIYRNEKNSGIKGGVNVFFAEEDMEKILYKAMETNAFSKVNLMHDNNYDVSDKLFLYEIWLVEDPEKDKSNLKGQKLNKMSIAATYQIIDNDLWEFVKSEKFKGFSIEVSKLGLEEVNDLKASADNFEKPSIGELRKIGVKKEEIESLGWEEFGQGFTLLNDNNEFIKEKPLIELALALDKNIQDVKWKIMYQVEDLYFEKQYVDHINNKNRVLFFQGEGMQEVQEVIPEYLANDFLSKIPNLGIREEDLINQGYTPVDNIENLDLNFAISSQPNAPSSFDTSKYKVLFKYQGPRDNKNRDFCAKVLDYGFLFRKEDINQMSFSGDNINMKVNYSIFQYKGGYQCRHIWKRMIFAKDPNGNIIGERGGQGIPMTEEEKQAGTRNPKIS